MRAQRTRTTAGVHISAAQPTQACQEAAGISTQLQRPTHEKRNQAHGHLDPWCILVAWCLGVRTVSTQAASPQVAQPPGGRSGGTARAWPDSAATFLLDETARRRPADAALR